MPSQVALLAERQRARILLREADTMRQLANRWLEVERAMQAEILLVALEAEKRGGMTEAMLLRNQRFQNLMMQARDQYGKYATDFEETVSELQALNVAEGGKDAAVLLDATKNEFGIEFAFEKINVRAVESMVGFTADGSPLRSLLMKSYGNAVDGLMQALIEGTSKGWGTTQTATEMAKRFGIGFDRALLIARTEQMRSYRLGALEQFKNSGVVMQYKRLAKKDDKTCLGCLFRDGEIYSTAEEFSEHPNGRCVMVPVVNGRAPQWKQGTEWFTELPAERQKRILGNERFALWQNGTPLTDFSKLKPNEVWGGAFIPTPLVELRGN